MDPKDPASQPKSTPPGSQKRGPVAWLRRWPTWAKWTAGVVVVLFVLAAIFGEDEEPSSTAASRDARAKQAPRPVAVKLKGPDEVRTKSVVVAGTVDPAAATLTIDEKSVDIEPDGSFEQQVPLDQGANIITATATAAGYKEGEDRLTVYRQLTEAERRRRQELARQRQIREQQAAERRRQARLLRQQQARDNFIARTQTIDYNQLAKNPDDYRGTKVKYTGQIFQIQEDYGVSVILLSVTDEGYGIWDDNIWVNYPGEIDGAEEDIITVYGTVTGEQSYQTQIGGETYVPRVRGRYIDE